MLDRLFINAFGSLPSIAKADLPPPIFHAKNIKEIAWSKVYDPFAGKVIVLELKDVP